MKRKIFPHGRLKSLLPEGLEIEAETVAEAMTALSVQFPALAPLPGQERISIEIPGFWVKESLFCPMSDDVVELHLVPALSGGKNGGLFQVILGSVMVVAGVLISVFSAGTMSYFGVMLALNGALMVIGGVLQMMSPAPKTYQDPDASKYIGVPQNTTQIGTRIPILYGRQKVYGQVLSMDINAVDMPLTYNASADVNPVNINLYIGGQKITPFPTSGSGQGGQA